MRRFFAIFCISLLLLLSLATVAFAGVWGGGAETFCKTLPTARFCQR